MLYGFDVLALDDLPDPEVLGDDTMSGAIACAHRLMTPQDALVEIGETEPYNSVCIGDWLGGSFDFSDPATVADLEAQATAALLEEPFAAGAAVTLKYQAGALELTAQVAGAPGPLFKLVVANGAAGVTASLLLPGQT